MQTPQTTAPCTPPQQTIGPREFIRLRDGGQPCHLIDVRSPAEYARVHARGAILMPLDQLDPATLASSVPSDQSVFLICHSGTRAAKAREKLASAGWKSVACIEGGTAAWERDGCEVIRGRGAVSLDRQVRIVAGLLVVSGVVLALLVHPGFIALAGFVGAGLIFAGVTDTCAMGLLLARAPWNRRGA